MLILLPIARFDYGRPEWGDSFEYLMFVDPLRSLGHDVQVFDTMGHAGDVAVDTQQDLLTKAREMCPDLILMMLFQDEISVATLDALRTVAPTANWFADDAWRFHAFSRNMAPHFDWVVTTSRSAHNRYAAMPDVRSLYSPWGFNPSVYRPEPVDRSIDVSFVGQRYGRREATIQALQGDGFDVRTWGGKWPQGRLPSGEIAGVFSKTRVNLNFSESSAGPIARRGLKFRGWFLVDQALARVSPGPRQLKARVFEIAACRSFQLTGDAEGLEDFFDIGEELVTVDSYSSLRDATRYFLDHPLEREGIADAAYRRCVDQYSYPAIFRHLFHEMDLD